MNSVIKSWLSGLSIAAALGGCVPLEPAEVEGETELAATASVALDDHQYMPLLNMGSGKCFEGTPQDDATLGLPIQQRGCSYGIVNNTGTIDRPGQYYQFQSQGYTAYNDQGWFPWSKFGTIPDGTTGYLIRNLKTNLCLDARDGAKNDSSVVQQWECKDKNARSMMWYVEPGDFPGMIKIRNFNSDLCLDVRAASWDDGGQLQQYHCTKNNVAQSFTQKYPSGPPVANLNGNWTDGSTRNAVISVQYPALYVDMSAWNRPAARGWFNNGFKITVNFPDYGNVDGEIFTNSIKWSNGSSWVRR